MFSFNERLGLFLTLEASCLSLACVLFILGFVVYKRLRRTVVSWGKQTARRPDASDSSLFLNLMFADLIQALGNMPSFKWMIDAQITEGQLCTAQAAIKQVGIVGVAMTSLAISVHTFSVLVLRWNAPRYVTRIMVIGVWVFAAIVIGTPNIVHAHKRYYGDTGYWCWILVEFKAEEIVTEYLWVWVAGIMNAILYTIMFVVMRGWFIIDNGIHWHKNYTPSYPNVVEVETEEETQTKAIANLMLFYPAVYIFCCLPNSISRWRFFNGIPTPDRVTFLGSILFALSGTFNVSLFFLTRPELVIGPKSDRIIEDEHAPFHHRWSSSGGAHKLGHLPERQYTDAPPAKDRWNSPEFDPKTLTSAVLHTSPQGMTLQLPPREGRQHSKAGSSLIEEEDYGHLPA
ncbi:hypothetical protein BDN70DRAFT_895235 [Pholiota conissans]|uniref:Glucose receptor Git3 N-terminal domain-containing protein n=1 Tax=Pholiota conissans TaxID=109636 RepID=A0A9P6D058_9AGAR|nr:hypothetical protein BDN70DRAFT_895235 [Pholiota conissans]